MSDYGGFNFPQDLIEYCALHVESERKLFSVRQINAMVDLAGLDPVQRVPGPDTDFYPLDEMMREMIKRARARLKAQMKVRGTVHPIRPTVKLCNDPCADLMADESEEHF